MNGPFTPNEPAPRNGSNPENESALVVADATAREEAEERALAAFGLWFDAECDRLVARWIHLAAPNAQRPQNLRRRGL
ncbi:MAG TPA: hypothetical protein VHZ24_20095 [Pirellulales bacterium]|jgi:hypothetical protein|nr:hypothetical protein [Pirellulales bacterium]